MVVGKIYKNIVPLQTKKKQTAPLYSNHLKLTTSDLYDGNVGIYISNVLHICLSIKILTHQKSYDIMITANRYAKKCQKIVIKSCTHRSLQQVEIRHDNEL